MPNPRKKKGNKSSGNDDDDTFNEESFLRLFRSSLAKISNDSQQSTSHGSEIGEKVLQQLNEMQRELEEIKNGAIKGGENANGGTQIIAETNNNIANSQAADDDIQYEQRIKYQDVQDSITVFDGESNYRIQSWIEEIEQTADEMNWTSRQTVVYAKKALSGLAKRSLKLKPDLTTFEKLKSHLISEFSVKISSAEIHQQMAVRIKKKEETLENYFMSMRELGALGGVEDQSVIEYTIKGIVDTGSNKLLLYGAMTVDEFKQKLKLYAQFKTDNNVEKEKSNTIRSSILCYNCGDKGHSSKKCPNRKKGVKCFGCNEFGHIATKCPKKLNQIQKDTKLIQDDLLPRINRKAIYLNNYLVLDSIVDTGSDLTLLREDVYLAMGSPTLDGEKTTILGVGGCRICTLGRLKATLQIDEVIEDISVSIVPVEALNVKCVVGNDFLREKKIILGVNQLSVELLPRDDFLSCYRIEDIEDDLVIGNQEYEKEIRSLINDYKPEKSKESNITLKILLKDDKPVWQHPRRLSPGEKVEVDNKIEEWQRQNIIRPSVSEFASPVVLVSKKDQTKRLCIDYRRLNREIIMDRYPLPLIDDQIDRLHSSRIFTTLDLRNGFFHVKVDEASIKYTAFVIPTGHFEFLRMPFGLSTAPAVFQRYIHWVFRDLMTKSEILVYMDDIIIPSINEENGLTKLKKVLQVAAEYGLEFKWRKCQFLCRKINYLGYEIEEGFIKPSEAKTKAVEKFPQPTTIKQIQSFLGLTGYFRRFVANYSIVAKPLSDLLKKNVMFQFGSSQKLAFAELKKLLTTKPVLCIFRPEPETELHTDASKFGFGAILLQKGKHDGQFHPVYYFSKKTSPCQEKYSSYELAIIASLKKLRVYLLGLKFKIVTDCAAFKSTMTKKDITPRIAGWALQLEEFDYVLEHRAGTKMKHVDALSRNPIVLLIQNEFLERIRKAQQEDDHFTSIIKILQYEPYENFIMERGVLYKKDDDERKLLCVPKKIQGELIKNTHEIGHFGTKKMTEVIARDYFIPNLKQKCDSCRRNCIACILAERKAGKQEGFLHPIDKDKYPLVTYHIDYLGPMHPTSKQYKYIFSIVDAFAKFVWIYPVKTMTADEAIKKLEIQKTNFGNPKRIIADRGPSFRSSEFFDYCTQNQIDLTLVTSGVPRGNGQIERINRLIIPALSKMAIDSPEVWFKYTDRLQRYINSTWQRSIGTTPFELLFGVRMRNVEDQRIAEVVEEEMMKDLMLEKDTIRETARNEIMKVQEENRRVFNRKRKKASVYKMGDIVAIKRTQFGSGLKLMPKFLGPYKITEVGPNDRYKVEKLGEHAGPIHTRTSADFIKTWRNTYPDEDDTDGDEDSEADVIPEANVGEM